MMYRVILYHKQATSARTRFLKFNYDSILAPKKLPELSQVIAFEENAIVHPASILTQLEKHFGFEKNTLKAEGEYLHGVEVPGETIQIILTNIATMDPPFDIVEKIGASFIDLTQARGLPQVELELLRYAYELVLGG